MLSSREEYIKKLFIQDNKFSDEELVEIISKISKIGDNLGYLGVNISNDKKKNEQRKHKYDVWIAKEVKKDNSILEKLSDIRLIIDWAYETKANIFNYSFKNAMLEQAKWHLYMRNKYNIEDFYTEEIDFSRIIFKFSDNKHFLYLLNVDDLKYEGNVMGNCVGSSSYKQKLKNKTSIILSIRDNKNEPHVTIEIDTSDKQVVQQYCKGNSDLSLKYRNLIKEFLMFYIGYKDLSNKEMLKYLNLNILQ